MAIFQIYDKEDSGPVAVKQGFNFNAFVAIFIWALFKRLWLVGITGAILWITYQSYQAQFSIFISSLLNNLLHHERRIYGKQKFD
ncbi:hypothetical protein [Candidatus Thioglobus sp. NP1]|uniref:hypothetical protein n=1 Tax=Candidatus Thioglobus sp. NP1 TaxID=2508687 RepID=UPI000DED799D|nr:hypothetical protein [Candidatus Thioglobus sp. NP1]AXE62030.1 hypothetical protein CRN91_05040 [Candidatus Thioglobus sp. NP1]